jgi:hypothetical protein
MRYSLVITLAAICLAATANAQQAGAGGSLVLTGQLQGSIALFFWQDPNGYQLVEGGSNTSIDLGEISAYGTANGILANKLTKGMDSDGFHLSTPFLLQVMEANVPSSASGYTLTAQLGDNDSTIWEVDGNVLSTTPALLSSAEPYTTKVQHTLYVKFVFSKPFLSLTDTITFIATAN